MPNKKRVTLRMPSGDIGTVTVLYTFWYKGDTYAVYNEDGSSENMCRLTEWNFWHGASLSEADICVGAMQKAELILSVARAHPERYPLCGEHYEFDERILPTGERQTKVKLEREAIQLDRIHRALPLTLRMLITLMLAVFSSFLYLRVGGLSWGSVLFPSFSRIAVKGAVYMFTSLGAMLLCFFKRRSRGIGDLYLHSAGMLCTITTLGALKSQSSLRGFILIGLTITALLAALPKLLRAVRAGNKKKRIGELIAAAKSLRVPLGIAVVCTTVLVHQLGIVGPAYSGRPAETADEIETSFSAALDVLAPDVWSRLSVEKRLDALQAISAWECVNTLGIEPVSVQTGFLDENVLGEYTHVDRRITVSLEHMEDDDVGDVVHTVLHETRHAYQHTVTDMYELVEAKLPGEYAHLAYFDTALAYCQNYDNYQSGTDDYSAYASQAIELDSDEWADSRMSTRYAAVSAGYQ